MKMILLLLLMSMSPAWASEACTPPCKPMTIKLECQQGRFKNQCLIIGCMGRSVIIVKDSNGKVIAVAISTPCLPSEVILYNET
jgi:hypothetical protein